MDEQTLAGYGAIADRLFRIEFCQAERHLAWLLAQCDCDWIMRLDGDEVPSRAFLRRLPDMLASRAAQQFWTPNAWLFPDAARFLRGAPWADDFACRLMRNGGTLRVPGIQHVHTAPVAPREYVAEPFYHLDLLTTDLQSRRDKAIRYEVARPHMLAAGGGRINEAFYLPELRDSLDLHAVPEEDRPAIARALADQAVAAKRAPLETVPFISLVEMDRVWEGRAVSEDAYRARIEPRERTSTLAPSEQRHVFFAVSNEGTERWPASLDADPPIRLSYRWLNPDASVHVEDGPRSPFSRVVDPGESILTPLHVDAPPDPGDYILEVDVVHEHVRWFGCSCRVPVRVERTRGLPATGIRLKQTPPPRGKRWRRTRIPRTIHRVWLGEEPMPAEHERFGETFAHSHPSWELRLWSDEDLPGLDITAAERERARTPSELSNLVRYEVLRRHGGVYVDTDVDCLRPLTPLLRGLDAFAALERPGRVGNAVLGSVAGHPAFTRAARLARRTLGIGAHSPDANGPYFLSLILEQEPANVAILPARLFYPYLWDELERRHESFPDAYAVHHWTLSGVRKSQRGS
ncbi:MAG TPA: glycosyltransferase [Solirubrobacteraceae bacterium]|nr:glycosyltransferase [Solirubrobacteraceae bacterium]